MPQAISYTRFSSMIQSKGSSTERQKALIAGWLEQNPEYELSPLSEDDHGVSGFKGEHLKHGLGSIINAIKTKKIKPKDVLIIEALDRLGRLEPLEMLGLITQIINSGVAIITLEDNKEYSQESTKNDISALYILLGKIQQAHEYSERLSVRIKAAYASKLRTASEGNKIRLITPLWLNTDGTLREAESAAVRACIDLYLKGRGTRSILLALKDEHPCLESVHPSTIKRWFKNRAIIGEWQGTYPFTALIDNETFYKLQRELENRSKEMSPEQTYSLSGITICGVCDSRYYYRRKEHSNNTIIYGNCSTYLKRGKPYCANNKSIPYEILEFIFSQTHSNYLWKASLSGSINKTIEKIETIKSERNELSIKIKNIMSVLEKIPDQEEAIIRLQDLNMQREAHNKKLLDLESGKIADSNAYSMLDFASGLDTNPEQSMDIWNKRMELLGDSIMLREALKKVGYKILVNGHAITAPDGSIFELIKRSQIHHCYILKCIYNDKTGKLSHPTWAAVSRNNRTIEARTEADLYLILSPTSES